MQTILSSGRGRFLLPLLGVVLALLVSSADAQDDGSGTDDNEVTRPGKPGDTLTDDEDFTGKVPVTFFATSTLSCSSWKDDDRRSGSQTIINKMIVYVAAVCECDFDTSYLSPLTLDCNTHAGTLLVSTNLSLPYNHQRSQLVGYLENWIKTEPRFTKNLDRGGRATVSVVNLETTHPTYSPAPEGSGEGEGKSRDNDTPHVVSEGEEEGGEESREGGSGSGSGEDILGSSSHHVAMDIGTLFLSCLAAVHLVMNYS